MTRAIPESSAPPTGPDASRTPSDVPTGRGMMRHMLPTIVFDIVLPIVILNVASSQGFSDVQAYLLACLGPLLGIAVNLARTRRLDVVSAIFLGMFAVSAVIAGIGSTETRWLLLKDSAMTGAFGVMCLLTMLPMVPKPLMFYFGRRFSTDGSAEARERWEHMWETMAGFRRTMSTLTLVWGIGMLGEAVLKVVAVELLDFKTAFAVNQVLPFVVVGVLITWTITFVRRKRSRGAARPA